jgi:LmbE family N-acetylglucosaminyl deacetylase
MRAHAFLDAADRLPLVELDALLGDGGAVVVAPHPDDESLGCGALIAMAAAEGRDVRVVIVSDGVGSHPTSRTYPPARLRALRESEALEAIEVLGLTEHAVTFLGLPDRFVPAAGREAREAATLIADLCRYARARSIFVTWRHDPHCDHQAAYAIARIAQRETSNSRLFEYPIWGRSLADEDVVSLTLGGYRLNAAEWRARKRAAILRHRSQLSDLIDDDPSGFRLSATDLVRFDRSDEVFLESEP